MADDILTRNAAGELEVRTVATTGDTGTNKDDVYTRDAQGRLAVRVSGTGGGGGGASSASDLAVSTAGLSIITSMNAQGAFQELDSATKDLQDSASILTTSVELSTEIGGTTVVMLDELVAMDIDGRPSYKQAGATVYAENGVVGIIDTVDTANQTADIKTVQFAGGQSVAGSDNGIKGDYCTTYGITDMPNGVITTPAENNNLIIPAGIVLKAAGAETLTTLASETTHETTSTDDFTLFYAGGEMLECGDVYYSETEPTANGVSNYQAWFSPIVGKWQFRSNDTGNVWREAVATPLCDCKFTDGNITRIDFVGYRVLNKQTFGGGAGGDYLPLSGGTMTGTINFADDFETESQKTILSYTITNPDAYVGTTQTYNWILDKASQGLMLTCSYPNTTNGFVITGLDAYPRGDKSYSLGRSNYRLKRIYVEELTSTRGILPSNIIKIPEQEGTMVVATPPTGNGTYVLKATVVDGVVTTEWVLES